MMRWGVGGALAVLLCAGPARATDPPHDGSRSIQCKSCHTLHTSPGGTLTAIAGNANLCMSCHMVGGPAAAFPFVNADQALPAPGLPGGTAASGNSHRWDSGPSGWVAAAAANTSLGTVVSGGTFTGRFAKTYTMTITGAGDAGVATFSWTATTPGGGSGSATTGAGVALDEGITVGFLDGATSPSFVAGDQWNVYVRTDLNLPTNPQMAVRLENGKIMCSTCHDQHSQSLQPFDPAAPAFSGPGTGEGRHFQRAANDTNQLCVECHEARDVASATLGSHPVSVSIPGGDFTSPATLPLDASSQVACLTCHQSHFGPAADGTLQRLADTTALCTECHTLADTATPAEHFDAASANTLWPGGQYGSTLPAVTDAGKQGSCTNCHQPHGWPDSGNLAQDYPVLLADFEESLCFTCHDGAPVAPSVRAEFQKASNHPLGLAAGTHDSAETAVVNSPDRHVECQDCHNPPEAKVRVSLPGPSTTPRPASGPLDGVRGVNVAGAVADPAAFEYEVCFRCHGDSTGKPAATTTRQFPETNVRLEFDGSNPSYHPVTTTGKNPDVPSLIGGWATNSIMACTDCHNSDAGPGNGGAGPNGPHGSVRPTLLERRYDTADPSVYTVAGYALCFKCHDSNSIWQDQSFPEHRKHLREDVSCNACHDAHGSSGNKKLINFDTSIVSPFNGTLEFRSTGQFRGECTLSCHGEDHDPFDYKP